MQHLGTRGLLLQRLGQLTRALLLRFEQTHVFDRDHRLVGKCFDQLDLLLSERPHGGAVHGEYANGHPLS